MSNLEKLYKLALAEQSRARKKARGTGGATVFAAAGAHIDGGGNVRTFAVPSSSGGGGARRPGRPAKPKAAKAAPGKRGRPRKAASVTRSPEYDYSHFPPKRKGRGRPKRTVLALPAPKKKRGRPPGKKKASPTVVVVSESPFPFQPRLLGPAPNAGKRKPMKPGTKRGGRKKS